MVQQYQRITAALVFGCILWLLVKTWMYDRRRLRLSRRLALLGAAACVLGIVRLTLWRPGGAPPGAYNLRLFWSYGRWLTKYNTLDVILQVYFNVELYIPLGLFLHNVLPRGHKPVWIGLGPSVFTETVQWACVGGLCELDDIWHNTLGAAIGAGLCRTIDALVHGQGDKRIRRYWNGLKTQHAVRGLLPCVLTIVFFFVLHGIRALIQHE